MTNEELVAAFPECEHIKREHVAPLVERVFAECKTYREIHSVVWYYLTDLWPKPKGVKWDDPIRQEWSDYIVGNYKTDMRPIPEWTKRLEDEFFARNGELHTLEEACQLAADEWARMIFGNHVQNNGDKSDAGGMAMVLGTLAKDKASRGIDSKVVEKFRELCKEFYLSGCRVDEDKYGWRKDEPYCDYHPNESLSNLLLKAGVPEKSIGSICPWKTGITINERDHSVRIGGYQTERFI